MKKDRPGRKIVANPAKGIAETVLPAKMERTEFLKRLVDIPTPELPASVTRSAVAVAAGGVAMDVAKKIPVVFEVAHPESSMVGTPIKLMVGEKEPLVNAKKTLADMGVAPIGDMVLCYSGKKLSSAKSLLDISYCVSSKIYVVSGTEPVEEAKPAAAIERTKDDAEEQGEKKVFEDPLVATARFLKALLLGFYVYHCMPTLRKIS